MLPLVMNIFVDNRFEICIWKRNSKDQAKLRHFHFQKWTTLATKIFIRYLFLLSFFRHVSYFARSACCGTFAFVRVIGYAAYCFYAIWTQSYEINNTLHY